MMQRLSAAAVSVVALFGLAACSADTPQPTVTVTVTAGSGQQPTSDESQPTSVTTESDGTVTFEGDVQTETIKVGPQDVEVPLGIKLPETSTVSDAQPASVMIIDEDPTAVIDAVTSSAEEAGYEVFAQPNESTWVFVGHGNAVLLSAYPQAQVLTWGPEAMAELLAEG